MKENDYSTKYLKYKKKYVDYKNVSMGGGNETVATIGEKLNSERDAYEIYNNIKSNKELYNTVIKEQLSKIQNDIILSDLFNTAALLGDDHWIQQIGLAIRDINGTIPENAFKLCLEPSNEKGEGGHTFSALYIKAIKDSFNILDKTHNELKVRIYQNPHDNEHSTEYTKLDWCKYHSKNNHTNELMMEMTQHVVSYEMYADLDILLRYCVKRGDDEGVRLALIYGAKPSEEISKLAKSSEGRKEGAHVFLGLYIDAVREKWISPCVRIDSLQII